MAFDCCQDPPKILYLGGTLNKFFTASNLSAKNFLNLNSLAGRGNCFQSLGFSAGVLKGINAEGGRNK